jgi:hypothetical protein
MYRGLRVSIENPVLGNFKKKRAWLGLSDWAVELKLHLATKAQVFGVSCRQLLQLNLRDCNLTAAVISTNPTSSENTPNKGL